MSSLTPERPLLVYPSVAATIGLEEAALLSLLDELTRHARGHESRGYIWYELGSYIIEHTMAFWNANDIQRLSQRLRDLGIILLLSAPYGESHQLKFAFNQQAIEGLQTTKAVTATAAVPPAGTTTPHSASLMAANWQPDRDTLLTLAQLNIPEHFCREHIPEFVHYWRERGDSQKTWGSKFVQHVKRQWTHYVAKNSNSTALTANWLPTQELQEQIAREGIPVTFAEKSLQRFRSHHINNGTKNSNWDMPFFSWLKEDWEKQDMPFIDRKKSTMISPHWQPDEHTINYLVTHGIETSFIEECVPEFIHKWTEKKAIYSEWGTIFAQHVSEQWQFVQAGVKRNPQPQIIHSGWQPSADCMEILETHSGIHREFIQQQIPEFILYWTNRAQPMHSWDNIFLRHVKHQWKQYNEKQQSASGSGRTKDRSVAEQLSDRSWAS